MPTIKQLPTATSVSATDLLPVSQGGVTRALSVGGLLSSTQTAISLATGKLLGRASAGAGGPEAISVGVGLALVSATATVQSTGGDHLVFPASSGLMAGDSVVVNSGGAPMQLAATSLRSLFAAGNGVTIDGSGTISATGTVIVPATTTTLGGVKVGSGLTVAGDGTVATDTAALAAQFATNSSVQTTVQAAVAAAAPSARQFGVNGNGSADNLSALQAYINSVVASGGGECLIPPGRFVVSGTLTATLSGNTALTIRGSGADVTELVFSGTDGVVVTYSSNADYRRDTATGAKLRVVGLSVVQASTGVGFDGIRIVGDSANASGAIEPPTTVEEVTLRGTSAGGSWLNNLVYQDVANTQTSAVSIIAGSNVTASTSNGVVIRTTGSRYATLHAVNDLNTWQCDKGMSIAERIQGVEVVNSNFTGGNYGIYWNSVGRQEQLSVANCQFSTLAGGVYVYNVQNVQLVNNTFYNQNAYASSPGHWVAIGLAESDTCQILGNGISGGSAGTEIGIQIANDLAVVGAARPIAISGNTMANLLGQALVVGTNAATVLFTGNSVDRVSVSPPVGVATGAAVAAGFSANQFGGALYLLGYPGSAQAVVAGATTSFAAAPSHPTPAAGDNTTTSATTAFVQNAAGLNGVRLTSGSSYAMAMGDRVVVVNKNPGSATAITLPASPLIWGVYIVKDGNGDAGAHPITISGSVAIDGAGSFVLSANFAAVSLVFNGVQWSVV